MKLLYLTHANFPDMVVEIHPDTIFYKYFSPANKCVHIVANGGAFVPVKESLDEINQRLANNNPSTTEGKE